MEPENVELNRMVEEKLDELSKRVSEIEVKVSEIEEATKRSFKDYLKYIELVSQNIYLDDQIGNRLNQLEELAAGDVSLFGSVFDKIQKKSRIHGQIDSLQLPVVTVPLRSQIEIVLSLSKRWEIPFEEVGSCLVDKLGREEAERLVEKEDIMQYYGEEAAHVWESLLKEAK